MTLSNSRFTDRLNTNYVPSDCEVLEIRTLLVDPTEEIARIDAQIAEMESSLVQLRKKRGLLQQPIDAHRALISPMRLIPQDILQEIFLLCLPSKHNALIDPNEAPLLLGRISRHWRDVAYSTPMLWSSIHIPALDYGHAPPNLLLRLEKIVAVWLERSASCALSVSLYDFVNRVDYNPNLEEHPLVLQLVAVSRRLRNLGLAADAEHLRPLLQLGPEDLPLLRRIHMQTPSNQRPSTNLLQTPTLRDLKLSVFGIEDLLALPLPWSQLTTLHLDSNGRRTEHGRQGGVDLDGALDVLRQCSNIEQCEIRVTKRSEFSGSAQNQPPIIVPRLHTLVISGRILLFQTWIADLVAPNLRSLRIGSEPTGTTPPNQECLSVDIASNRFTSTSILELLRSFPMISHFRVLSNAYFPPRVATR
ncbi:hypothetical protein MSAN_01784100 [Mycena sanguinolenta]|uniref:F-box domain-containing protein n=1 Tax=Mycena sanguinolenta TaxID=230812 RepID=A0A8H6XXQ9_9AGAR|nr:hypothetical protein MSAN_01784100 [Mycena sanguinolenta]